MESILQIQYVQMVTSLGLSFKTVVYIVQKNKILALS